MDLLNLKIKESSELVNFLNDYIDRIIPLIETKHRSDISHITNFKTKIVELNNELKNADSLKYSDDANHNIEIIFDYFEKVNTHFSSIKYLILIFSKSHLQPTNADNDNLSQTYRLETNDLLSELISKHHNFIKKFDKFDDKIVSHFSKIINDSIINNTTSSEIQKNDTNNKINKLVDLMQQKIISCRINVELFTKVIEDLILNINQAGKTRKFGNVDNKSLKPALFYIYDKIEEVKNSIIDGYSNNRFSSEVNKHLHIINPSYKKFGLIPVSDSLKINDILSYMVKTKKDAKNTGLKGNIFNNSNDHCRKGNIFNNSNDHDIKSNEFKKMMENNKITIILLNHIVYTPIEYNIHPLFNADIIKKYNLTQEMGVNKDIIKRFNCIKNVGDFPIIHWMHQDNEKYKRELQEEADLDSDDASDDASNDLSSESALAHGGGSNDLSSESALAHGGGDGSSNAFLNVTHADSSSGVGSVKEKLKKNETWLFSYEIIGSNDENDTFYVLESLAADYYRFLAPWLNTSNYKLSKFRVKKLLNFLTNENRQDRISNYNNIQINNSIKNMFLPKQLEIDIMQEHSKDIDLSLVKNILFNSISKVIEKYVNDVYKEGSLIKNAKDINDIIHQKEIKELFINSILKTYNLGSKYTDLSEYHTSKFPFSEVFSTFLVELLNLSVLFMKNLHDELNRFEINLEVIFSDNNKSIKIIKLLNDIIFKTINNIINSDNLYYCLNYKFLLLNI